jgi:hypothetical protein
LDVSTANSPLTSVLSVDRFVGAIHISGLSTAGVTGLVELARIRVPQSQQFSPLGTYWFNLVATEMRATDLTDMLAAATLTQYPISIVVP